MTWSISKPPGDKKWYFSFDRDVTKETDWLTNNEIIFSKILYHFTQSTRYKLSSIEGWDIVQEEKNGLELVQSLHNINSQKDGSKHYMLELVEAQRNLMLCFQHNKI